MVLLQAVTPLPLPLAHTFAFDESAKGLRHKRIVLLANEVFSSGNPSHKPEPLITEDPGPMRQEEEKVSALTQLPASAGTSAKGQW